MQVALCISVLGNGDGKGSLVDDVNIGCTEEMSESVDGVRCTRGCNDRSGY